MKRHDRDRADALARLQDLLGPAPEFGPPPVGAEPDGSETAAGTENDAVADGALPPPETDPGDPGPLIGTEPGASRARRRSSSVEIRALRPPDEPVKGVVDVLEPPAGDAAPQADGYEFFVLLERGPGFSRWYARSRAPEHPAGEPGTSGAGEPSRRARRRREEDWADPLAAPWQVPGAAAERMVVLSTDPSVRAEAGVSGEEDSLDSGGTTERAGGQAGCAWPATRSLRHPHLLRIHDVRPVPPNGELVATEMPEGGSLAELLAARTRVEPGEAARILGQLGAALSALRSVTNSPVRLRPESVYFSRDGRALLAPPIGPWAPGPTTPGEHRDGESDSRGEPDDTGPVLGLHGTAPDGPETAENADAEDVLGLSRLAWRMLSGRAPGPARERIPLPLLCPGLNKAVVLAVEAGLDEDPGARPPLAEILQILRGGIEETEVDLHESVRPEFAGRLPARRAPLPEDRGGKSVPCGTESADGRASAAGERTCRRAGRSGSNNPQSVLPHRKRIPIGPVPRSVRLGDWARSRRRPLLVGAGVLVLSAAALGILRPGAEAPVADGARADSAGVAASAGAAAAPSREPSPGEAGTPAHQASYPADRTSGAGQRGTTDPGLLQEGFQSVLDARDAALTAHDPARIGEYAVPGGELASQDTVLLRRTAKAGDGAASRAEGENWQGLSSTASDVRVLGSEGTTARLRATVHVSGYSPSAGEAARADGVGGSEQVVEAVLARSGSAWRAVSVRAVE